jgi:hypothetical protein
MVRSIVRVADIVLFCIAINFPSSVENLYLDCAVVASQTPMNPYPVQSLCDSAFNFCGNLRSISHRCFCVAYSWYSHDVANLVSDDLIHLISYQISPPDDVVEESTYLEPQYLNLESFIRYRQGRFDMTPGSCEEIYTIDMQEVFPHLNLIPPYPAPPISFVLSRFPLPHFLFSHANNNHPTNNATYYLASITTVLVYAVQALHRGNFPQIKRSQIP